MTPPSSPATAGPKHRVWLYNCRVHGTSPVWRDDPVPTDGLCNAGDSTYPPWKEPCRIIRTLVGPGDAHLYSSRGTTHCDNDCLVCFPSSPGGQAAPEPSGQVTETEILAWREDEQVWNDPLARADFCNRLIVDLTEWKRRIEGLEAALRERSEGFHDLLLGHVRDCRWDKCDEEPCKSDRALLVPSGQEREEEAQHEA